jgi:Domain of unknown function (DUF3336)
MRRRMGSGFTQHWNWMFLRVRPNDKHGSLTLGREAWKDDPESTAYQYELVQKRLNELREARTSGDLGKVLFLLRISLSRSFADMGNPEVLIQTRFSQ